MASSSLNAFTLPSPPFAVTSLLSSPPPFTSLALFLSDQTALLCPSLPFNSSSRITLPSPSIPSLSAFSLLKPSNTLLFLSFAPTNPIAYHLRSDQFAPIPLRFKRNLFSPFLPFSLGFRFKSSHNLLAIHSVGASQIWLLFVNLKSDGATMVELKKCAVIQLANPVYDMCLDFGCLILGEKGGIRVFPLLPLVKGKGISANKEETKLRALKIKQNARDYSFFMTFRDDKNKNKNPVNAVSIRPFCKKTLLVLDFTGDLHFFSLKGNSGDFSTNPLEFNMKVQLLAVLPNFSSISQIFYVSDGGYLLNKVSGENELSSVEVSGTETIFTGERIKDLVPISNNSVLVLTQGNLYVYCTA